MIKPPSTTKLGDMNEPIHTLHERDEGAELLQMRDGANACRSHGIFFKKTLPWIIKRFLVAQRNPVLFPVNGFNHHIDGLTDGKMIVDILYAAPADFRDRDEPVHTAEIGEGAKIPDGSNGGGDGLTFLQSLLQCFFLLLPFLLLDGPGRNHKIAAVFFKTGDKKSHAGVQVGGCRIIHPAQAHL